MLEDGNKSRFESKSHYVTRSIMPYRWRLETTHSLHRYSVRVESNVKSCPRCPRGPGELNESACPKTESTFYGSFQNWLYATFSLFFCFSFLVSLFEFRSVEIRKYQMYVVVDKSKGQRRDVLRTGYG